MVQGVSCKISGFFLQISFRYGKLHNGAELVAVHRHPEGTAHGLCVGLGDGKPQAAALGGTGLVPPGKPLYTLLDRPHLLMRPVFYGEAKCPSIGCGIPSARAADTGRQDGSARAATQGSAPPFLFLPHILSFCGSRFLCTHNPLATRSSSTPRRREAIAMGTVTHKNIHPYFDGVFQPGTKL